MRVTPSPRRLAAGALGLAVGGVASCACIAAALSTENNGEFHVGFGLDWMSLAPIALIPLLLTWLVAAFVSGAVPKAASRALAGQRRREKPK